MYDIFVQLCEKRGISGYKVCKDLGISQSVISNWKNRGNNLNSTTLRKIANYFDVSVDYLETGKEFSMPEFEPEHLELIRLYSKLNEEQKKTVMTFLRSLAPQN